jgi:hypothetical protein
MDRKDTLQLLIWVATLFFVVMMFAPLVFEMVRRLALGVEPLP